MLIHEKIGEIIESRGIKQSFIVKSTGMNKDAVSNFLAGKRKLTAEEFLTICDLLEIDPNIFKEPHEAAC